MQATYMYNYEPSIKLLVKYEQYFRIKICLLMQFVKFVMYWSKN